MIAKNFEIEADFDTLSSSEDPSMATTDSESSHHQEDLQRTEQRYKIKKLRSIKLISIPSLKKSTRRIKNSSDQNNAPNYMKGTSCSDARKENLLKVSVSSNSESSSEYDSSRPSSSSSSILSKQSNLNYKKVRENKSSRKNWNSSKENPVSQSGRKSGKILTKTISFRPVRILTKTVSLRSKNRLTRNCSENQDLSASKATCSSTFKKSKFSKIVELEPQGTEVEGSLSTKICPYTYCSLHGHQHGSVPPLKRFLSIRRRELRSQKSMKSKNRPQIKSKNSKDSEKVKGKSFISVDDHCEAEEYAGSSLNSKYWHGEDTDSLAKSSDRDDSASNKNDNKVSAASVRNRFNDQLLHGLPPLAQNRIKAEVTRTEVEKYISLWCLLHRCVTSGEAQTQLCHDDHDHDLDDHDHNDAIKLVEKAIDEMLLPEIQSQSSSDNISSQDLQNQHHEKSTDREKTSIETETKTGPKNWSKLKKLIIFKRFINALDKVRNLNFKDPKFLPSEIDPEAERVSLRHQSSEERNKAEEWMLDYALRQVVGNLSPNRRKKVELLVEAFETVIPVSKRGTRVRFDKTLDIHGTNANEAEVKEIISNKRNHNIQESDIDCKVVKIDNEEKHTPFAENEIVSVHSISSKLDSSVKPEEFVINSPVILQDISEKYISNEKLISLYNENGSNSENIVRQDSTVTFNQSLVKNMNINEEFIATSDKFNEEFLRSDKEDTKPECHIQEPDNTQMEKHKYMQMWRVIYHQVVSGNAAKFGDKVDGPTSPDGQKSLNKLPGLSETDEAIKLVEKAIDEFVLPDTDKDNESNDNNVKFEQKEADHDEIVLEEQEIMKQNIDNKSSKPKTSNWGNLKKLILLNRFVKALDKVREFKPRGPRFLSIELDQEPEKVNLKHQTEEERKKSEDWMIDNAIQQVVARLTPARKRRVELLVEAFETVTPLSDIKPTPKQRIWPMRSPREPGEYAGTLMGRSQVY